MTTPISTSSERGQANHLEDLDVAADQGPASGLTERIHVAAGVGIASAYAYLASRARLFPDEPEVTFTVAGRYTLLKKLGEGAMGVVFCAFDARLDRRVALKFVRAHGDGASRERLVREAKSLAQLSDPHVVQVYDWGVYEGDVYLAMELVEGPTLAAWVKQERPGLSALLDVVIAAGKGLAAAHAKNILHRDIKPANILVAQGGRVRVADFGLAAIEVVETPVGADAAAGTPGSAASTDGMSLSGAGTPEYMSPEQILRRPLDRRSDLFSYCVVVWEVMLGAPPFERSSLAGLQQAVCEGRLSPPVLPPRGRLAKIQKILRRGLEPARDRRYLSMDELLAELGRVRHPPRPAMWTLVVGGAAAVIVGAASFLSGSAGMCKNLDGSEASWPEARASVVDALAGLGQSTAEAEAVAGQVGLFAEELRSARVALCEQHADGTLTDAQYHRAQGCFAEREQAYVDVVAALRSNASGLVLTTSVDVSAALGAVARCKDPGYLGAEVELPTSDAAPGVALVENMRRLGTSALVRGEFLAAAELFAEATMKARAVGHAPTIAAALYDLGRAQMRLRMGREATSSLREARLLADGANDPHRAADAALLLLDVAVATNELPSAEWEYREALARLHRTRRDRGGALGELELARAGLLVREGRAEEAAEVVERARTLLHDDPPSGGLWRYNLPRTTARLAVLRGDLHAAAVEARAARAALREIIGSADHPLYLEECEKVSTEGADPACNESSLARAREICARALGEDSVHVASVDVALARLYDAHKRDDAVARAARRASQILDRRPDEPMTLDDRVVVASFLGRSLTAEGRYAEARVEVEQGLAALSGPAVPVHDVGFALLSAQSAELLLVDSTPRSLVRARDRISGALQRFPETRHMEDPERARFLLRVAADVALANEDAPAALRFAEAARRLLERAPDPETAARVDYTMAQALGREDLRARALAEHAASYFRGVGSAEAVAEIEAWIAGARPK